MKKIFLLLSTFFISTTLFAKQVEINSKEDLLQEGLTVGCNMGSASQVYFEKQYPDINVLYLDIDTGLLSIKNGKLAGYIFDKSIIEYQIRLNHIEGLKLISLDSLPCLEITGGISRLTKIPDLKEKYNEFFQLIKKDGTFDEMYNYWFKEANSEPRKIEKCANPKGVLTVGTTGIMPPYTFFKGTDVVGFDIELNERFAAWLGYDIQFKVYDFAGIVAAAATGQIDSIFTNFNWTKERAERIDFTESYFSPEIVLVVEDNNADKTMNSQSALKKSFGTKIKESFEKNFIRESRWKLLLSGLKVTVIISVLSLIFGLVFGFILCMLRRMDKLPSNIFTISFVRLVQGMPTVVLLMILYYIIFGSIDISGITVAVIGFSINFGAYASEILRSGMNGVEKGQIEAACALGYSKFQIFMKIILPQAAVNFIPVLKGEFISMVKMTSIVGYIAVSDLTKVSDIIRSRTMEAFFPLIMTAVIYFVIAWLFTQVLVVVEKRINPKQRKNILKGIKIHKDF